MTWIDPGAAARQGARMIRFVFALTAIALPVASFAQTPATKPREIEVEVPGERSQNNKILLASIGAAGVIASALGVYWHLDSRDASKDVSADYFTGEAWTEDKIDIVDRAERSKTRATIAYSIGGALIVGAIATWILTAPESETTIIRTGGVVVTPTHDGGGIVTRMWSF
jgi:hypothetical protein